MCVWERMHCISNNRLVQRNLYEFYFWVTCSYLKTFVINALFSFLSNRKSPVFAELAYYIVLIFALAVAYECLRGLQKVYMLKARMPTRRPIRSQQEKNTILHKRYLSFEFIRVTYHCFTFKSLAECLGNFILHVVS